MDKGNTWVDYKKLKASVTMEMVLARYPQFKLRRTNKTNLQGACQLPTHKPGKGGNSFGVSLSKNVWACKSESCIQARGGKAGGNVGDFVAVMEGFTFNEAARLIASWFPHVLEEGRGDPKNAPALRGADQRAVGKEAAQESDNQEGSDEEYNNKPLGWALQGINPSHPYLKHRGIRQEMAQHFGVGFFAGRGMMSGRVVIPIFSAAGELIAYAGRSIDDAQPKYKFPPGFRKSLELFNLHRALKAGSRGVIVVEGFFDVMKVHQAGFPHVVALMGCSLSDAQEQLLCDHFDEVTLMLDGDAAGVEATGEILVQLSDRLAVRRVDVPLDTQPDMLSSEVIRSLLRGVQ